LYSRLWSALSSPIYLRHSTKFPSAEPPTLLFLYLTLPFHLSHSLYSFLSLFLFLYLANTTCVCTCTYINISFSFSHFSLFLSLLVWTCLLPLSNLHPPSFRSPLKTSLLQLDNNNLLSQKNFFSLSHFSFLLLSVSNFTFRFSPPFSNSLLHQMLLNTTPSLSHTHTHTHTHTYTRFGWTTKMKKSLKASFPAASSLPPSSTPTITLSALQKKNTKVWNTHTHTPSHTNAYKQNTHARLSHS